MGWSSLTLEEDPNDRVAGFQIGLLDRVSAEYLGCGIYMYKVTLGFDVHCMSN